MIERNRRPPPPIESFGPELLAALVRGSTEEVRVPLPYVKAVKFRLRLNQLRNALRLRSHELYPTVSRTKVSLLFGKDAGLETVPTWRAKNGNIFPEDVNVPAFIIISPYDSEFNEALVRAGLTREELKDDPLRPENPQPTTESGASLNLDDILNPDREPST